MTTRRNKLRKRPSRKTSEKAVRELADAIKAHKPGTPWKLATPNPLRGDELSKKAAWLTPGKLNAEPKNRKEKSYRQQAIEAGGLVLSERLAAHDTELDQVKRIHARVHSPRRRRI